MEYRPLRFAGVVRRGGGEEAAGDDGPTFTDEEIGTTCCFATQDKVWVTGPAGEKWEVYTVLEDSETFGSSPRGASEQPSCC